MNNTKTFEQLEIGDFLKHNKMDSLYFIADKGIDYITLVGRPDEPKWLVSKRFYDKGDFELIELAD